MSWEFASGIDAGHRATLTAGKNLIYVTPPAWWSIYALLIELPPPADPGLHTVVIVPDALGVREGAELARSVESLRPVHAVTGLARAGRLLRQRTIATLITTPSDMMQLLSRSSVALERVTRIVIGWPESLLELGKGDEIDAILAEVGMAQRIIISSDDTATGDFLERHARRAPRAIAGSLPETGSVSLRYAVTDASGLERAARGVLDIINPGSAVIWDPTPGLSGRWQEYEEDPSVQAVSSPPDEVVDLAIAAALPTPAALEALDAAASEVLVLVHGHQVPYLKAASRRARPFRIPSEVDRARDRAGHLREEVRGLIAKGRGSAELLALEPLFHEYDPATIAAALAARADDADKQDIPGAGLPAWVHLRVSAGSRDRIRTQDLVGALLNAVGIAKGQIGRVEVRDGHSLLEVRAEVAETVRREMDGLVLRGKKVAARIDRR